MLFYRYLFSLIIAIQCSCLFSQFFKMKLPFFILITLGIYTANILLAIVFDNYTISKIKKLPLVQKKEQLYKEISNARNSNYQRKLQLLLLQTLLNNESYSELKNVAKHMNFPQYFSLNKKFVLLIYLELIFYHSSVKEILEAENLYLKSEQLIKMYLHKGEFLMQIHSSLGVFFYVKGENELAQTHLQIATSYENNSRRGNLLLLLQN